LKGTVRILSDGGRADKVGVTRCGMETVKPRIHFEESHHPKVILIGFSF
jgi:hypothetical protein